MLKPFDPHMFDALEPDWFDKPPVSEWSEEEKQLALDVLNGLSCLAGSSYDKAIFVAKSMLGDLEDGKRQEELKTK